MTTRQYKNNTSGYTGVSYEKKAKKWRSYLNINNKKVRLGYFNNKEEAARARREAERFYSFKKNVKEIEKDKATTSNPEYFELVNYYCFIPEFVAMVFYNNGFSLLRAANYYFYLSLKTYSGVRCFHKYAIDFIKKNLDTLNEPIPKEELKKSNQYFSELFSGLFDPLAPNYSKERAQEIPIFIDWCNGSTFQELSKKYNKSRTKLSEIIQKYLKI